MKTNAAGLEIIKRNSSLHDRLWAKIDRGEPDACWLWIAGNRVKGYGYITCGGDSRNGKIRAHRAVWADVNGPIPDGMVVRHKCDNPGCCNPEHLILGTHADNVHDRCARGRSRHLVGEANAASVLTEDQVRLIRSADLSKWGSQTALARQLGVSQPNVNAVLANKTWRHIQ